MRKVLTSLVISLVLCLSSCSDSTMTNAEKAWIKDGWLVVPMTEPRGQSIDLRVRVIEIDGCEYLVTNYDRGYSLTHKGNCKACRWRD